MLAKARAGVMMALALAAGGCLNFDLGEPKATKNPPAPSLAVNLEGRGIAPPLPGPDHPGDGPGAVFAVSRVFLGDTDWSGKASVDAWTEFGFNIDGRWTACEGAGCKEIDNCRPLAEGSGESAEDGAGGIDNSFGANITPMIGFGDRGGPSLTIDTEIERGDFTLLIAIDRLGADADENPLAARFYNGAPLGHAPKLDGSDVWPVSTASLVDASDIGSSKFAFPASFVAQDTWVSGLGELTLVVPWYKARFVMPLHHAVVTMDLSSDRRTATHGVISGIVDPTVLGEQFLSVFSSDDDSFCHGSFANSLRDQIMQDADILLDGRAGDDTESCTGISVGIGFEAVRAELGDPVDDPGPPDPCAKPGSGSH